MHVSSCFMVLSMLMCICSAVDPRVQPYTYIVYSCVPLKSSHTIYRISPNDLYR